MDTKKIYNQLKKYDLDAYLMYDFRGSNFLGRKILGFETLTTRKFVSVLATNGIFHVVSKMESANYTSLPGKIIPYTSFMDFENELQKILVNYKNIAADISENNELPIVDLAPYGFIKLLKKLNPKLNIISAENFTQSLAASWGKKGYKSHKKAAEKLTLIFGRVFDYIHKNVKRKNITDLDAMRFALKLQKKAGLTNDGENVCIVASGTDTINPHYWPHTEDPHPIRKNSPLLLDMWARTGDKSSVYADFTMYAWVGPKKPSAEVVQAWTTWKNARDMGVSFIKNNYAKGIKGYEVDREILNVFKTAGYQDFLLHRSGHSLGQKEHGNGANIDNFETHDTRQILPDTGMTIEPGLYMQKFGVRGEIDLYIHESGKVEVTTPLQDELIIL